MGNFTCPVITDAIREIYTEVQKLYPEASKRANLTVEDVAGMVDIYSSATSTPIDNITKKDTNAIINHIEKQRNRSGKSFKHILSTVVYTPTGKKQQTYTILKEEGTSTYKIFNKDGAEVFPKDTKDRRKIFANFAVQQGRAVVVTYKDKDYVVNNKNEIISVTTGDKMKWGEENGDRKEILRLSQIAFREKQKTETSTTNPEVAQKDINFISNKSEAYGVIIDPRLKFNYNAWQQSNPKGIVAYRVNFDKYATPAEVQAGHIGNPFSEGSNRGSQTVQQFYDWLVTGNNFSNPKATEEFRQAIIQKILETPENSPVLYYTELNRPSHATVIGYLINNKQLLNQSGPKVTQSKKVEMFNGYWTREQVANQQDKVFLFGDNTNDRVSTHYVPSSTQAVIRGLPNAIGIDTKKNRGTGANSYFTDADFDQFKAQVDSALNAAKADGRTIVIPADGIGTGKAMLKEKAPRCFEYLQSELQKLQNNTIKQEDNRLTVKQLIDHLKASGINVLNKAAMEKFFKEHPNTLIQQALEEQWEMQDIKAKAIADGTFMKAPNGKDTNLTERQWLQVRTKNFINWFGDWINDPANASKVVDENGEPKVMLRTDDAGKAIMGRGDGGAFFATDNLLVAGSYASNEADLYKGFVNLKNPYIVKGESHGFFFEYKGKETTVQEAQSSLIQEGYDGVYFERTWDVGDYADVEPEDDYWANNVAMFNPNQIKSATDNNGMFSTENDDIQMFIGKKARTQFEQSLRKARPDMSDAEIQSTLDFLHSLEDNKENTAYIKTAIRWVANRSITLPEDNTKARQAFNLARKKNVDIQKYKTLGELIVAPEMQPKEKEKAKFDPDKARTFSNKRTVTTEGGRVFTVYDVENTEEGQREVCKALAAHYEMSPWCLSTFTATGEPTESAKKYWNIYNYLQRKIAFENGKPVAFNSDSSDSEYLLKDGSNEESWWDIEDSVPSSTLNDTILNKEMVEEKKSKEREEAERIRENELLRAEREERVLDNYSIPVSEVLMSEIENSSVPLLKQIEKDRVFSRKKDTIIFKAASRLARQILLDYANSDAYIASESNSTEHPPLSYELSTFQIETALGEAIESISWTYNDFFITPEGEIYGFVDKDGNMYLDETIIDASHPIHEYTHLWDRALAKNNPQLWKKGVKLMQEGATALWNKIANSDKYGKLWQSKGIKGDKLVNLIASEVHARLVGENGAKLLDDIAKEKGNEGIIAKLKQWILNAWKELKATFSNWSQEEIDKLTLKDFNHMTVRDFADGINPNNITVNNSAFTINQKENRLNNNKEINYGNDFRRIQETVRKSGKGIRSTSPNEHLGEDARQRLAGVLRNELGSQHSTLLNRPRVDLTGKGNKFGVYKNVDPQLFHDIFEVVRYYTPNGELVDLHYDYSNCKCYLNEDGTCGFAIEADGNLISVFNLGATRGFLWAIKDLIIEEGATHLDAYASNIQNLKVIYEKVFGAKTASSMDYNSEYDHDNIEKNHGEPKVEFMVIGKAAKKDFEEKHFNKDQYDEAVAYQKIVVQATIDETPIEEAWEKYISAPTEASGSETPLSPSSASRNNSQANPALSQFDAVLGVDIANATPSSNATQAFENKPKPEEPKSAAYESALKVKSNRTTEFKRTFSPQQIKDRGAMIANIFSEIIDDALWDEIDTQLNIIESDDSTEDEKDEAKLRLKQIKDPLVGRQTIAQELSDGEHEGVEAIVEEIKRRLQMNMEAASEEMKPLWQNTIDYFDDLFNAQATLDIEEKEGIRIIGLKFGKQTTSEDNNDDNDDGNDETGHIVSGSDGWSFQIRFTNPFDSLSKRIRGMLYEVEKPGSEKDDLGQVRHYPMGQIYASLLSYLASHMENADDFIQVDKSFTGKDRWGYDITQDKYPNGYPTFPVLEQMKVVYPWVQQIIDRLTDDYLDPEWNTSLRYPSTGGAMASQFYTNFRKAYIPYGKISLNNGEASLIPLNYQMEERVQVDKLQANYNNRMILSEHSIYNADGKVNRENAEWLKAQIKEALNQMDSMDMVNMHELMQYHEQNPDEEVLTDEDIKEYNDFIDNVRMLLQSFGIDATTDGVVIYSIMENGNTLKDMLSDLHYVADRVSKVADDKVDSFNYMLDLKDTSGRKMWLHFFEGRGMITDNSYMQSFYDSASKKTKYSYSADNYLMKTFRGVCMGTLEQRRKYIDEHYGRYEWYRRQDMPLGTGWRNSWLEFWYNYEGEQKEIPYVNIDNITVKTGDGSIVRKYAKWTPDDIWQVQTRSYNEESKSKTAFYLAPIFSDSPMSMTVKGPRMNMEELLYGYTDEKGNRQQGALVQLVNQELWRIGYVQRRAEAIKEGRVKEIANFDTGVGSLFCFLPELNTYMFENGESFLDRMVRLKNEKATAQEIEASQIQAIEYAVSRKMAQFERENSKQYFEKNKQVDKEMYYNMVYANAAIIQMTTVDLAFYGKGKRDTVNDTLYQMGVDFQKRYKEVYAGGIQLNTNSKYGEKTENVILLTDDVITSPNYKEIASIIDGKKTLTKDEKEKIKKVFRKINVADAQAIRAMHSFRSILDMMGNWTDEMEQALQNFKNGTWSKADFDIIYQTIKPFVYSVIERNDGFGSSILVPQQHKNSEICALMMYDLITNGFGKSDVYKALSEFMDRNTDAEGNHLINMAQFESGGKVGNQGVINISFEPNKVIDLISKSEVEEVGKDFVFYPAEDKNGNPIPLTIDNADKHYKAIREQLDKELIKGNITQETHRKLMQSLRPTKDEIISMLEQKALITDDNGNKAINPEVVHTIPFDNYYQQQPTPEHHIDAEATFGSQGRNIGLADLPEDFEMTVDVAGGKHTFKGRDAVIDFCYELLNENLIEDFFGKNGKGGLKGIFASKESLRDAVTEIVRGNPKYGRDFADALQIDEKTGEFVLSPNSPTVFNLMQEIITSFFKNRITKQTINGAALIQAAGIGLDEDLRLKFDKDGKLLGAECLMPLTSKKFFEPLLETKIVDGKEVKILDPKKLKEAGLDKAVGYRIPTENKSSMMPLIIKDFTPLQNGSAIVLPAEITAMAGSDFDVDKMFVMLLSFSIQEYNMRNAKEAYEHETAQKVIDAMGSANIADLDMDEIQDVTFKEWFKENKERFKLDKPIVRKVKYDWNKSPKENGRKARNNMLIQMYYNILTSKAGSEQLFNPQGFDDFKYAAKINRILTDRVLSTQLAANTQDVGPGVMPSSDKIVEELLDLVQQKNPDKYDECKNALANLTQEEIKELYIKLLTANNQRNPIDLLLDSSIDDLEKFIANYSEPESPIYPQTFTHSHARNMAGVNQIGIYAVQASMCAKYQRADVRLREEQQFKINGRVINNVDVSDDGRRLKNVGQPLGASADNGKDPNLSDAGSTTDTAPIIGYMLRAGMSHLEAVLLMNQPFMKIRGWQNWSEILGKDILKQPMPEITTKMLAKSLFNPLTLTIEEEKAIAGVCYRVLMQHEAQKYLTQISRADSPNGALKNSYAKGRIQRYKVDLFNAKMGQDFFPFVRIKEALSNNAIDTGASEEVIREQLKGQRMAFLHGMYALGINSFDKLMEPYFFGAQLWFDEKIVKPILYNLSEEGTTDAQKEEIVNNIYNAYITYILSGTPLFGNEEGGASMKSKREYYLKTFPGKYLDIIRDNAEIRDLLSSFLQVKDGRITLQDVGSLGKGQKQDIQRRLEQLFYLSPESAKLGEELATRLFIYSYYDNGLQFVHDSFSHLFTTGYIINFPTYTDTLNELEKEIAPEEIDNFIKQFLLTYRNAAYNVNDTVSYGVNKGVVTVNDTSLTFDLSNYRLKKHIVNEVMSPNPKLEGNNVYPYVRYNGDIYILNKDLYDSDPSHAVYQKIESYRTFPKNFIFSRQMSVTELAEQFPMGTGEEINDSVLDDLYSHNDVDVDPTVDSSSDSSNDDSSAKGMFDTIASYESETSSDDTDKHISEGKEETKEPMCGVL